MKPQITVHVEGFIRLTPEEVWPDGDIPKEITAKTVAAKIGVYDDPVDWLDVWNLATELDVTVTVTADNPAWHGDDTLPGLPAVPRQLTTTAIAFAAPVTVQEVGA